MRSWWVGLAIESGAVGTVILGVAWVTLGLTDPDFPGWYIVLGLGTIGLGVNGGRFGFALMRAGSTGFKHGFSRSVVTAGAIGALGGVVGFLAGFVEEGGDLGDRYDAPNGAFTAVGFAMIGVGVGLVIGALAGWARLHEPRPPDPN